MHLLGTGASAQEAAAGRGIPAYSRRCRRTGVVAPPDLLPGQAVLIHSYRRLTAGVLRALIEEGEELQDTVRVDALHDTLDAIDPPDEPRPSAPMSTGGVQ